MLFIDHRHPAGTVAVEAVQKLLTRTGDEGFQLEIKDVTRDREEAQTHDVFATPTLLRLDVTPPRRVVGDLSDAERVTTELGLV